MIYRCRCRGRIVALVQGINEELRFVVKVPVSIGEAEIEVKQLSLDARPEVLRR